MSTGLRAGTNNDGHLQVNGTDVLTALSSGYVGINNTNPTFPLDLTTSNNYSSARFISTGYECNISLKSTSATGRDYRIVTGGAGGGFSNGHFGVYDATASAIRLAITSEGNIGIGAANATAKLQFFNSSNATYLKLNNYAKSHRVIITTAKVSAQGSTDAAAGYYIGRFKVGTTTLKIFQSGWGLEEGCVIQMHKIWGTGNVPLINSMTGFLSPEILSFHYQNVDNDSFDLFLKHQYASDVPPAYSHYFYFEITDINSTGNFSSSASPTIPTLDNSNIVNYGIYALDANSGSFRLGVRTRTPSETVDFLGSDDKVGWRMYGDYGVRIGYYDNLGGDHGFHLDTKHNGSVTTNAITVNAFTGNVRIGQGNVEIASSKAITFARNTGNTSFSNVINVSDNPDGGYSGQDNSYWLRLSSYGGTHIVLNADGAYDSGRNTFDHFTIFQKDHTEANNAGKRLFAVDNVGGVQFGEAGFRIDREWSNYPSISVQRNNAWGADNTTFAELRVHGSSHTHASWVGGASGADWSVNMRVDGGNYYGSDRRHKTNIVDNPYGLDEILRLQPRKFNRINSSGDIETDKGDILGFIAQEVLDVIPEAVNYYPDEDVPNENGFCRAYALSDSYIVSTLVNAVKELNAKIESLESQLNT